jgi:hypothetical protein
VDVSEEKRAPFSSRKAKRVVFEDNPKVGPSIPPVEIEEPHLKTEALGGGIPAEEKQLPPVHLGEYHDPAHRFKPRVEPPQKKIIPLNPAPAQPVTQTTEAKPTAAHLSEQKETNLGGWAQAALRSTPDYTAVNGEKLTRSKTTPVKKDVAGEKAQR